MTAAFAQNQRQQKALSSTVTDHKYSPIIKIQRVNTINTEGKQSTELTCQQIQHNNHRKNINSKLSYQ